MFAQSDSSTKLLLVRFVLFVLCLRTCYKSGSSRHHERMFSPARRLEAEHLRCQTYRSVSLSPPSGLPSGTGRLGSGPDGCQRLRRGPPQLRHQHALQELLVSLPEKRLIGELRLLPSPSSSGAVQQAPAHLFKVPLKAAAAGGRRDRHKHVPPHRFSTQAGNVLHAPAAKLLRIPVGFFQTGGTRSPAEPRLSRMARKYPG